VVAGVPAKKLRDLRSEEIDDFAASAARYVEYARRTSKALEA
jgi:carbonic anhydrase/acetyltransferase-like protein (isoleucine patch superfamily)